MVTKDPSKELLNQLGAEMFNLCIMQLEDSIEAFLKLDKDLAENVMHTEDRVWALLLAIEQEFQAYLTLHRPIGVDLRFVMILGKAINELKYIGDYALGISRITANLALVPEKKLLKKLRLNEMFSCAISMLKDIQAAYLDIDNQQVHKVFKKERKLNDINNNTFSIISLLLKTEGDLINPTLLFLDVIKKVERIGDLATNIAQEIIFYREEVESTNAKLLV